MTPKRIFLILFVGVAVALLIVGSKAVGLKLRYNGQSAAVLIINADSYNSWALDFYDGLAPIGKNGKWVPVILSGTNLHAGRYWLPRFHATHLPSGLLFTTNQYPLNVPFTPNRFKQNTNAETQNKK